MQKYHILKSNPFLYLLETLGVNILEWRILIFFFQDSTFWAFECRCFLSKPPLYDSFVKIKWSGRKYWKIHFSKKFNDFMIKSSSLPLEHNIKSSEPSCSLGFWTTTHPAQLASSILILIKYYFNSFDMISLSFTTVSGSHVLLCYYVFCTK